MENSLCKISKSVKNWLRNPQNSFTLIDKLIVNLTIAYTMYTGHYGDVCVWRGWVHQFVVMSEHQFDDSA